MNPKADQLVRIVILASLGMTLLATFRLMPDAQQQWIQSQDGRWILAVAGLLLLAALALLQRRRH